METRMDDTEEKTTNHSEVDAADNRLLAVIPSPSMEPHLEPQGLRID